LPLLAFEPARETPIDGGDELAVVDGLLNEILGTGLYGRNRHGDVSVARKDYHRIRRVSSRQLLDQLDAVHSGHSNVSDDATDFARIE
jgi:hypothetical protein